MRETVKMSDSQVIQRIREAYVVLEDCEALTAYGETALDLAKNSLAKVGSSMFQITEDNRELLQ
jgi:hypothetical protein